MPDLYMESGERRVRRLSAELRLCAAFPLQSALRQEWRVAGSRNGVGGPERTHIIRVEGEPGLGLEHNAQPRRPRLINGVLKTFARLRVI